MKHANKSVTGQKWPIVIISDILCTSFYYYNNKHILPQEFLPTHCTEGWTRMQLVCRSAFFQTFKSRFTQNITLLTSHIDHPKMYNLTSHFSYDISRFTFQIPHLHTYLTFFSLYLVV